MKNINRFKNHEEAENTFLVECWGVPERNRMIPWIEWDDDMKNRYRYWLFENVIMNTSKIKWIPNSAKDCSSLDSEPCTKTFSNTTIFWTNPPCHDENNTKSIEDYDKIAKEAVDAWFEQHEVKKPRLNKDRFDDYNSAWNCFEYECSFNDKDAAEIYFSRWLFYPYNPSIIKGWKNGCE